MKKLIMSLILSMFLAIGMFAQSGPPPAKKPAVYPDLEFGIFFDTIIGNYHIALEYNPVKGRFIEVRDAYSQVSMILHPNAFDFLYEKADGTLVTETYAQIYAPSAKFYFTSPSTYIESQAMTYEEVAALPLFNSMVRIPIGPNLGLHTIKEDGFANYELVYTHFPGGVGSGPPDVIYVFNGLHVRSIVPPTYE